MSLKPVEYNQSNGHQLFGITFNGVTLEDAKVQLTQALSKQQQTLYFINAHCANIALSDAHYRASLHQASLIFPDGVGIEWGCKLTKQKTTDNLNGTDLFPHLCQLCEEQGQRIFLLGAEPGTAERVASWVSTHYPNLTIAGFHHGHFTESESATIVDKINRAKTDVLIVAMGVPRQELWIERNKAQLDTRLNIAAGGLFEYYSGNIPRASARIRRLKLEWIWRLIQEPRRLWRRYVLGSLLYTMRIAIEGSHTHRLDYVQTKRFYGPVRFYLNIKRYLTQQHARCRSGLRQVTKRLFDLAIAVPLFILLLPFLPVVALLIKIDSPGPLFFKQKRVGAKGQPFELFKLRSMQANAEDLLDNLKSKNEKVGGVMFKMKNDPRVTPIGRFLRRHSIDELPQIWNVIRGDMSLVGPRPPIYSEVSQYYLKQRARLLPKPGLTSQWVIAGRNDLTFEQQAELDIDYYFNSSLWSDLRVLLQTIPALLTGRGAS